ncbi:MAG: rplS [Candidatus Saganbacteria bacterium]|uniref:Large ribosomal subunit protein bL19 n=1 Tax=Candidatus Saganbacteria bacterium TaxID=2575572 RepID=A0A833L1I5_UNCSA|nr:MAG: rplS [Candidatus Saganbacteria bacterium]
MNIVEEIEKKQIKKDVPSFKVGDTIKVLSKIIEGGKERLQAFEGIVIKRQGHKWRETFTVRKIVMGIGVEKILPIYSPAIDSIQVIKSGKVNRAKLYYLRKLIGSAATHIEEDAKN